MQSVPIMDTGHVIIQNQNIYQTGSLVVIFPMPKPYELSLHYPAGSKGTDNNVETFRCGDGDVDSERQCGEVGNDMETAMFSIESISSAGNAVVGSGLS